MRIEERIRLRVRHFLLQKSVQFQRSLKSTDTQPSISSLARELHKSLPTLAKRRLAKYLSPELSPKDLSVTMSDLIAFAELAAMSVGDFMAYLLEEKATRQQPEWERQALEFLYNLHLGHRRALKVQVFQAEQKRADEMIEILLAVSKLDDEGLKIARHLALSLVTKQEMERK